MPPFSWVPSFLNCCSLPGSSNELISHNALLLPSPQVSLSDAPFLWAQGGDQSPLLPAGVGPDWGPAPGPYSILWPFLVNWSVPPMSRVGAWLSGESEHRSEREPGILAGGTSPCSSRGSFTPAWPSNQSGGSRGWCGWDLTGTSINVAETSNRETKHHTRRVAGLRFITLVGPEELTLQVLSPRQRGYRVFIHGQAWLSRSAGLQGLGKCKEQDKGEWDKPQFLVLWVPTFWDYVTYKIQTLQGASWVTEAEGTGDYIKF